VFIDFANVVLIESLQALASSYTLLDLTFLYFRFDIALIGIGLIIALSIVSLLLPMVRIKNIKPVKIIKAKE
jgi:ABC-type antimicrobial peptide transport system permease subunit